MIRAIERDRGVALILVLWVITLLTVMALGLTATQRTESTLTANAMDDARFRAAADAAVAYAVLNLLAPDGPDLTAGQDAADTPSVQWVPDGSPHLWTFAEVPVAISVGNEASRLDLNTADAASLAALMVGLGVSDDDASTLADRILDWRDPDDLTIILGAEDPDYEAAGLPYGAKDDRFSSVEELGEVLGMTPDLYRRLAPEVTVDSASGQVNQQFASAAVLSAVNGLTLDEAERAVDRRDQPAFAGAVPSGIAAGQGRGGPLYRIRVVRVSAAATADGDEGAAVPATPDGPAMEALVHVQPGAQPPYHVLWRRFGLVSAPSSAP